MSTEFDEVFEQLEAPEYPATCDQCGREGTNATMENHICVTGNESPAPRAGEGERDQWRALAGPPEYVRIVDSDNVEVARVYRGSDTQRAEAHAMRITTEHNQHATLVAQRDRLLEVLRDLVRQLPKDERLADYNLDLAESVITAIEQEGKS